MNDNDLRPIEVADLRFNANPASATWTLALNGNDEYPCEILNAIEVRSGEWRFDLRTTVLFAGPMVPTSTAGSAIRLPLGSYYLEVRSLTGGVLVAHEIKYPMVVRPGARAAIPPVVEPPPVTPTPGASVEYIQSIPAATWTITHNLGRVPSVQVFIDGELVETDVVSTSTVTTVTFPSPQSGVAVLF